MTKKQAMAKMEKIEALLIDLQAEFEVRVDDGDKRFIPVLAKVYRSRHYIREAAFELDSRQK